MTYEFARCECGWIEQTTEPGMAIKDHVSECQLPLRSLLVPMWSVAWPRYLTPEEEKKWGIEMSWRSRGSDSEFVAVVSGMDAKRWHLFPTEVE